MFEEQRNPYYTRRKERGKFLAGPPVNDFGKTHNTLYLIEQGNKIVLDKSDADFVHYLQTIYGLDAVIASYSLVGSRFHLYVAVRFDRIFNDLNRILCSEMSVHNNCTYLTSYNTPVIGQIADDLVKACCLKYNIKEPYDSLVVDIYSVKRHFLASIYYPIYLIVEELERKFGLDETTIKISSAAYGLATPTHQVISILIETPDVWDRIFSMQDEFENTCFGVIKSVDTLNIITKDDIKFCYIKAFALSPDEYESALKNYERYWGFRDRW